MAREKASGNTNGAKEEVTPLTKSRARSIDPHGMKLKRDRVQYVVDMMVEGQWVPGIHAKLGKIWGCSVSSVEAYAAEANRVITRVIDAPTREELRAAVVAQLWDIRQQATGGKFKDFKAAVQATLGVAEVLGLKAEPKPERDPVTQVVVTYELPEKTESDDSTETE